MPKAPFSVNAQEREQNGGQGATCALLARQPPALGHPQHKCIAGYAYTTAAMNHVGGPLLFPSMGLFRVHLRAHLSETHGSEESMVLSSKVAYHCWRA